MSTRYLRENPLKSQYGGALELATPAVLAPWYVGSMNREECEGSVRRGATGEFLVRRRSKGGYAVCVNDHGEIRNFSVAREEGVFTTAHEVRVCSNFESTDTHSRVS